MKSVRYPTSLCYRVGRLGPTRWRRQGLSYATRVTILLAGIDEAGYGPLLGPLAIVQVTAESAQEVSIAQAFGALVGDSKRIHTSGNIAAIEAVALAGLHWLTGATPTTAAACFALLGETARDRPHPWMAGADTLTLPVAAQRIDTWNIRGVTPRHVCGALIHPHALTLASAAGTNRAACELERIGGLLRQLPVHPRTDIICDRLGGRRYYRDFLATVWPAAMILIDDEIATRSAYRAVHEHGETTMAFCVDGEQASPLVALASCIAKYSRELHMLLLNRWWSDAIPGLLPTAGYGSDAHRWLRDLGETRRNSVKDYLVRQTSA